MPTSPEPGPFRYRMGWLPDYPDIRDFTAETRTLTQRLKRLNQTDSPHAMLEKVGVLRATESKLPASVDLSKWCSPVE